MYFYYSFLQVYYMNNNNNLENLKKMYENVGYFDQYGGSVILFILVTIVLFLLISYCYIMINAQPIIDDWANQRCKPGIIPFAGILMHPEGMSTSEYTKQNFNYCTQNILSSISGIAVEPLTFTTNMLQNAANQITNDLQSVRAMFDKVRTMFVDVSKEIMGRLMNIMIPLQQIIISFKDLIGKIQGTMTASLFTMLGSYYTLKSLLGAVAQFIVTILITLAIMIAAFWIVPITWGAAISSTAIFVAIAIPMAVILAFMVDVLKVQTNLKIPKVKCFDKNTLIKMNNGEKKKIIDIEVGDILENNNKVTATFKVATEGSNMLRLCREGNDIIVSDSHLIKCDGEWIRMFNHPEAFKVNDYNEPYLYCLNTSNKNIIIDKYEFSDWDEIEDISQIQKMYNDKNLNIRELADIHKVLESGFGGLTLIQMNDRSYKKIKDINIGDILAGNNKVYGIVKIDGMDIEQYNYNLGDNCKFEGGPNLIVNIQENKCFSTLSLDVAKKWFFKHRYLYQLLTDNNLVKINNTNLYDYNSSIDFFIQNTDSQK
jgi:hypothetical protein